MEKVSLIAWRRRERKFPETEAQQRAHAREQGNDEAQLNGYLDALEALAPSYELPELHEDLFNRATATFEFLDMDYSQDNGHQPHQTSKQLCANIDLTVDHSQALHSLPLLSDVRGGNATPLLFELSEGQDRGRITLQLSLYPRTVPDMISFKELSRRLKVGRRAVMRLVRGGELRCYRIANRYRFAIDDVNQYLERIAHQ
jgi:excisionase family DNA binding protein